MSSDTTPRASRKIDPEPPLSPLDGEPIHRFSMSSLLDFIVDYEELPSESPGATAPDSPIAPPLSSTRSRRGPLPPLPPVHSHNRSHSLNAVPEYVSDSITTPGLTPQSSPGYDARDYPPTPPSASEFPYIQARLQRSSSVASTSSSSSEDSTNSSQSDLYLRRRHHIRRERRHKPPPPRPLPIIPPYQKPTLQPISTRFSDSGATGHNHTTPRGSDQRPTLKPSQSSSQLSSISPSASFLSIRTPAASHPSDDSYPSGGDGPLDNEHDHDHEHTHGLPTAAVDDLDIDWDAIESALAAPRRMSTMSTRAINRASIVDGAMVGRRSSKLSFGPRAGR